MRLIADMMPGLEPFLISEIGRARNGGPRIIRIAAPVRSGKSTMAVRLLAGAHRFGGTSGYVSYSMAIARSKAERLQIGTPFHVPPGASFSTLLVIDDPMKDWTWTPAEAAETCSAIEQHWLPRVEPGALVIILYGSQRGGGSERLSQLASPRFPVEYTADLKAFSSLIIVE